MPKRRVKKKKEYQDYLREKIREGMINTPDGKWRAAKGGSRDKMCLQT